MDNHVPFWITTVATTPASPTTATAITLTDAATSAAPTVPFDIVIRRPGTYPTNTTATVARVTAMVAGNITAMTRNTGGMTAFPISAGDEVYQCIDGLLGQVQSAVELVIDGSTYPTTFAGLQLAENALPAGGGTIVIPHNTTITGTPTDYVPTKNNVTIRGANKHTSVIQAPANATTYALLTFTGGGVSATTTLSSAITVGVPLIPVTSLAAIQPSAVDGDGAFYICGYSSAPPNDGANGYLEMCRAASYSGNNIITVDAVHSPFLTTTVPLSHTSAICYRVASPLSGRRILNLTFDNNGNTGLTTTGIGMTYCVFAEVSDCVFKDFNGPGISLYAGYGNQFFRNRTINCGSAADGGFIAFVNTRWTMDGHESELDLFAVNWIFSHAGTAGTIRISRAQARSLKLLVCSGNTFSNVHIEAEKVGGAGLLINDECAHNNFGVLTMFGGDIGIDIAGTSIINRGHHNNFGSVVLVGQATYSFYMDGFSHDNTIGALYYDGVNGNAGTNNQKGTLGAL